MKSSGLERGASAVRRADPETFSTWRTAWLSILRKASSLLPLLRTITFSGSPLVAQTAATPFTKASMIIKAAATSKKPDADMSVVFQRTRRLRRLYERGIIAAILVQ